MKKKIISYSLYNQRPKDNLGMVINCLLAPKIYKDWTVRVYLDNTVAPSIRTLLETFEHVEIVEMPSWPGSSRMTWRFLAASSELETDYQSVMISRDADSYLSVREKACVDAWLVSNKNFHKIIGHCYHTDPKVKIMGGLWGCRNSILPKMKEEVDKFVNGGQTYDQGFLAQVVYPNILHDMICHYDDPSYNNKGERVYGQPEEKGSAFPIPKYEPWDEPVEGISWAEANKLNAFFCAHCHRHHEAIGGIIEHIPPRALQVIKDYASSKNVSLDEYLKASGL